MRRIAVSLSKGGVGKTTTAVNIAAGLARAGHSVLLIDTDTQGQAGRALGVMPETYCPLRYVHKFSRLANCNLL